jgi:hypothetical protein
MADAASPAISTGVEPFGREKDAKLHLFAKLAIRRWRLGVGGGRGREGRTPLCIRNRGAKWIVDGAGVPGQHYVDTSEDGMHIDLNEAIRIHARVGRARFGRSAKQRALKTAQTLRRAGDHAGASVWERLAAEIDRGEGAKSPRAKHAPL